MVLKGRKFMFVKQAGFYFLNVKSPADHVI